MSEQPGESQFWSETDDQTAVNRHRSLIETVGAGLFHPDSERRFTLLGGDER